MAGNLTNSVATVRRQLLRMMDALAETGMRHAHREISRGKKVAPKHRRSEKKSKSGNDCCMH